MKERPIIFNAEMVNAILSGRKTQTRRVIANLGTDNCIPLQKQSKTKDGIYTHVMDAPMYGLCPFGAVGDRLWVRETWQVIHDYPDEYGNTDERRYARSIPKQRGNYWHPVYAEAGGDESREDRKFPWRPSIHMPRWASRITLEITGVRVERLNSISDVDAKAEGYPAEREEDCGHHDAWLWYRSLWETIYGEESWQANPWVWVIEFKRVEDQPHDQ